MKAFLLAAGYGTRLKPLTDHLPKCLAPIHHQPLLGWWLKLLQKHGISEVLVNTHYRSEQVHTYVEGLPKKNIQITLTYEPTLLGTGGTIQSNAHFVSGEKNFLICYADNLSCVDLTKLIHFHESHAALLTMGLFFANNPRQCGIAVMNDALTITSFIEKPSNPCSNLANAGIYVASPRIFDYFPSAQTPCDFGHDILPQLIHQMKGYLINEFHLDIGTPENYQKANEAWQDDYI